MTKEDFIYKVNAELLGESEPMINDFIEYWTESSLKSNKMRFESEKFFSIKRRFSTWKRNAERFNIGVKKEETFKDHAVKVSDTLTELHKRYDTEFNENKK